MSFVVSEKSYKKRPPQTTTKMTFFLNHEINTEKISSQNLSALFLVVVT